MCKAQCCGMSGMLGGCSSLPKGAAGSLALRCNHIPVRLAPCLPRRCVSQSGYCHDLPPLGFCRALLATRCCIRRCMLAYHNIP